MIKASRWMALMFLLMGCGVPLCMLMLPLTGSRIEVSLTIPQVALDLSDLDVRDEHNRPLPSAIKKQELQNLFVGGLNTLLMFNLTPYTRYLREALGRSWDNFSGWIRNALDPPFQQVKLWWQKKRSLFKGLFPFQAFLPIYIEGNAVGPHPGRSSFQFLVSSIISSTVLLR